MYAQLCKRLTEEAPNFEPPLGPCTFRILLLNKCRAEFENRSHATEAFPDDAVLSPEDEEKRQIAKRKMLGNIKASYLYLCSFHVLLFQQDIDHYIRTTEVSV